MTLPADYTPKPGVRRCVLALLLASAGCVLGTIGCLALAPAALASSLYPSGASRPAISVRPSQLARNARSSPARPVARRSKPSRPAHPVRSRKKPRKPLLHGDPARALVAFEAMQKHYYIQGASLYSGEPFSYLWPFSQALAATVSMAYIPGINVPGIPVSFSREVHDRLIGLGSYLDRNNSGAPEGTFTSTLAAFDGTVAPPAGPGGPKYYDDNDWVGIELVRLYKLSHNASLLGSAEGIMAFEMAGWQAGPELVCPGGIPFSNDAQNTDRNTVTNGPAAELGVELYELTGNVQY